MKKHTKSTTELLLEHFDSPIIKASQAAALFDISRRTMTNQISKGEFFLPTFKVGRYRFVNISDLAVYIDNRSKQGEMEKQIIRNLLNKN